MADVIRHSTQYLRDADLQAIATYLKSLPPTENAPSAQPIVADMTAEALHAGDLARPAGCGRIRG